MKIAVYTLTSPLHDEKVVESATRKFLDGLELPIDFRGNDFSDYGEYPLNLIYVRTGGTEGLFRQVLPRLREQSNRPFRLLTSGESNSLAASLEILSFLRQQGLKGEILHGSNAWVSQRIRLLNRVETAWRSIARIRLGVVGEPSDWLISSQVDDRLVFHTTGMELVHIRISELLDAIHSAPLQQPGETSAVESVSMALPGANQIYLALKTIVERYRLSGFTLRCFDLLSAVRNTGCLALARLNAEGVVAGCEGDVPTLLTMTLAQSLLGIPGFQSNPARIDSETGEMLLAHCTIPLNMVERYELDTHFESGIGVGIRGYMKPGPVTIFKVAGDFSRHFVAEGELLECQAKPGLCRTQLLIRLADHTQTEYFFTDPIGNHHVVLPGHHKALLEEMMTVCAVG